MNILQTIFKDHYEKMLYILHPRQAVIDNVDKMINCGAPAFGGAMYACSKCGNLKFVPSAVRADFFQPVVLNTAWTDPMQWLLN